MVVVLVSNGDCGSEKAAINPMQTRNLLVDMAYKRQT